MAQKKQDRKRFSAQIPEHPCPPPVPGYEFLTPPLEQLLRVAQGSKFTLVQLASLRGREINAYYNQLSEGLGTVIPPQVTTTACKPLTIAFEEVGRGKIRLGPTFESPWYDLAISLIDGHSVEFYLPSDDADALNAFLGALDGLNDLGGYRVDDQRLIPGSIRGIRRLLPYGDGLSADERSRIEAIRRARALPDVDAPIAVEAERRMEAFAMASGQQGWLWTLVDGVVFVFVRAGNEEVEDLVDTRTHQMKHRRLSDDERAQHEAGTEIIPSQTLRSLLEFVLDGDARQLGVAVG